jgi:hypothetical protein
MSVSRKKVIVRKLSRDWLAGYLAASGPAERRLEMLDLGGKVTAIDLVDIKWVCFVRDFNSGEPANPERLLRKSFAGKPRGEGLWLRLRLKDNDQIEGLAANDATLIAEAGLFLAPPDARSNTQRIFVPRVSIVELEIVAVIGRKPASQKRDVGHQVEALQEDLFRSLP